MKISIIVLGNMIEEIEQTILNVKENSKWEEIEILIMNYDEKDEELEALCEKYENVKHITAAELLALIERNFGGGWDSISLTIKDIIESAFDISTTTLPASRMHVAGGTLERKVADGYDVLEIEKGTWIEAIFAKKKEPMEKLRFVPEAEYDEDGNRRIVEEDDDRDVEDDDDNTNDETFYGSYTPEADIKDVDEDLADD